MSELNQLLPDKREVDDASQWLSISTGTPFAAISAKSD